MRPGLTLLRPVCFPLTTSSAPRKQGDALFYFLSSQSAICLQTYSIDFGYAEVIWKSLLGPTRRDLSELCVSLSPADITWVLTNTTSRPCSRVGASLSSRCKIQSLVARSGGSNDCWLTTCHRQWCSHGRRAREGQTKNPPISTSLRNSQDHPFPIMGECAVGVRARRHCTSLCQCQSQCCVRRQRYCRHPTCWTAHICNGMCGASTRANAGSVDECQLWKCC